MVRYSKSYYIQNFPEDKKVLFVEGACESTDAKPTEGIATGSIMTEADTGDIYMFSEKTNDWRLFVKSQEA